MHLEGVSLRLIRTVFVLLVGVSPWVDAAQLVAFVTSAKGSGDFGSWPEAGGNTGLAAADAVCQARADAASLPGTFVAMASDSENDAYCRVRGLSGKRDDHCGSDRLPPAGPWVRRDGYAFAPAIDQAVDADGFIYMPVMFNEYGSIVLTYYYTGTFTDGRYAEDNACNDWTAGGNEANSMLGHSGAGTSWWLYSATSLCGADRSLLCLQVGLGDPLPPFWRPGAKVFVTSTSGPGDLSSWPEAGGETGIAAGDAICQARAAAAGLAKPERFIAWLSDGAHDAADRLTLNGPWTRIDGVPVADSLADLKDGQLHTAISFDENGEAQPYKRAWTGTTPSGTYAGWSCAGWSSASVLAYGTYGSQYVSYGEWTQSYDGECDSNFCIYCFSNAVTDVFSDSFESSDTAAWSLVVQ